MISTRIRYNGGKVRLQGFGFGKYQMLKLGSVGLASVKARVQRGVGVSDSPMPPLKEQRRNRNGTISFVSFVDRGYKAFKKKIGKNPIRDLTLTGRMLENLTVRSADQNTVKIGLTKAKERIKALANERRAPWLGWSPSDTATVMRAAEKLFKATVTQVFQKFRRRAA